MGIGGNIYLIWGVYFCGMKYAFFIVVACFGVQQAFGQLNCTDPQAINYNPTADSNDGSCVYPVTPYHPRVICTINSKVLESSGLTVFHDRIWTLNDSGGEPELYALDTASGQVIQTIRLKGLSKDSISDWEDLSQDRDYVYIADCGNNNGTRRDLRIFKVAKAAISDKELDSVDFEVIAFHYPQQSSFESSQTHNFDCEGIIVFKDNIHLFSKNRGNLYTYHYLLPTRAGKGYEALRIDSFQVGGQITGAAINPQGTELALLGYINLATPFYWLFWNYQEGAFFSGNKRRFELPGPAVVGQVEALAYQGEHDLLLSNEGIDPLLKPRLYAIPTAQWTAGGITAIQEQRTEQLAQISVDSSAQEVIVKAESNAQLLIAELASGRLMYQVPMSKGVVQNIHLPKGTYVLRVTVGKYLQTQVLTIFK